MNQYEEQKHERFVELMEEGMGAEEALLKIRLEEVDKNYQEFYVSGHGDEQETLSQHVANLHAQIRDFGYSVDQADAMIATKISNIEEIEALKKAVRIGKYIPVSMITGWNNMNEQQRKEKLWELGLNVRKYNYVIDILCQRTAGNQPECGEFVYCEERLDRNWLTQTIRGINVASIEARYFHMQDELAIMRGNKKQ